MKYAALLSVLVAAWLVVWLSAADERMTVQRTVPEEGEAFATNFAFRQPLLVADEALEPQSLLLPQPTDLTSFDWTVKPTFDDSLKVASSDNNDALSVCVAISPVSEADIMKVGPILQREGWTDRVLILSLSREQFRVFAGPFRTNRELTSVKKLLADAQFPTRIDRSEEGSRLYFGYFTDSNTAKAWAQAIAQRFAIQRISVTSVTERNALFELVFDKLSAEERQFVKTVFAPAVSGAVMRPCR